MSLPPSEDLRRYHLEIFAQFGTLFGIFIVNWLLTLVTLGIYYFWGRVKVRQYLFSQIEFAGSRFAFHGTGKELLIGFCKVLVILIPLGLLFFIPGLSEGVAMSLLYLAILALVPVALFGAKRYLLSRTSWRGIRFSFRGSLKELYHIFLLGGLFLLFTLGFYYPYFKVRLRRYWMNHTYFGNVCFSYNGRGEALAKMYYRSILITVGMAVGLALIMFVSMSIVKGGRGISPWILFPILANIGFYIGVAAVWFRWSAFEYRYHWNHTHFDQVSFYSDMKGWDLFNRRLVHAIVLMCTLGFGYPWTLIDKYRFYFCKTALLDTPDFEKVEWDKTAPRVDATGESMADVLDTGFDLGI